MAYSELIKKFERIRDYMREFYVYGFKSRDEYDRKSARSYDNERRRIESYLSDYMGFRQGDNGKNVFLSIDSRLSSRNPLYSVLKSKSFTSGDITLHFILLDILCSSSLPITLAEIMEEIDDGYLSWFEEPMIFDESTVRKKLKEYCELGLINCRKESKKMLYSCNDLTDLSAFSDVVEFFSEAGLCGVIGSFLLDKINFDDDYFSFKHHYITHALESEILCKVFDAMSRKCFLVIVNSPRRSTGEKKEVVVPLKVLISVQNGRRYLAAYTLTYQYFKVYRLDYLKNILLGKECDNFDKYREEFCTLQKNMWGVVCESRHELEHVEFTVYIKEDEEYIYRRLEREKRCGKVERIDDNTCRFSADVYDVSELNPWIRTFIGRIKSINYSNVYYENRFKMDLNDMYHLYEVGDE